MMHRFGLTCVLLLLFTLASCAVHDVSETKQPDTPKTHHSAYASIGETTGGNVSTPVAWQQLFADPQLHTLLAETHKNNYQVREMWLRVRKAQQAVTLANSARLPTGTVSLNTQNTTVTRANGVSTSSSNNLISLVGGVSWEADLWQKLSSQQKASAWLARASEHEAHAFALSVSGQVIDTWLDIRHASSEHTLTQAQLQYQKQLYRTLLAEATSGSIDGFTLLQQKNAVLVLEQEILTQQKRIAELHNALALYTGMNQSHLPTQWQPITQTQINAVPLVAHSALTPASLLANRLDMQQAFARLQAADYDIAAALANYWPSLSLSLQTTLAGDALASFADNITTLGVASIASQLLSLPTLRTQEAQARTDFKRAYAQFNHTLRVALKEVEDALIALSILDKQVSLARQQQHTAQELKEQAQLQYQAGALNYRELLIYENGYFRRSVALGSLISNALKARKNLALAAGIVREAPPIFLSDPQSTESL